MGDIEEIGDLCEAASGDEIFLVDMTRSLFGLEPNFPVLETVARRSHRPITFGGGLLSLDHVLTAFDLGAARVYLNSVLRHDIDVVSRVAAVCGQQAVVGGIEYRYEGSETAVYVQFGREFISDDVPTRASRLIEAGVGEILLTNIDRDGTGEGLDWGIAASVDCPVQVVVCGGMSAADLSILDKSAVTPRGPDGVAFSSLMFVS